MTERPILFNAEMVRAILEGRKTQTRRVMKPQAHDCYTLDGVKDDRALWTLTGKPPLIPDPTRPGKRTRALFVPFCHSKCPLGQPGDRLWVRETWAINQCGRRISLSAEAWPKWPIERLRYVATDEPPHITDSGEPYWWNKRPSIHMPRWASRITLEIVSIRVERVQDISEDDCREEGVKYLIKSEKESRTWEGEFERLWDSINAKRGIGWSDNPWVWVIAFKVVPNAN